MSTLIGLNDLKNGARRDAWLLILGIDIDSEEFKVYKELYQDFLN